MTSPGPARKASRPVENVYLIRERDRRRARELALVLLVVLSLGGGLLSYIWIQLEILRSGYRIEALSRQLSDLDSKERQLRLEAGFLSSPEIIERRAREELGMVQPDLDRIVVFRKR